MQIITKSAIIFLIVCLTINGNAQNAVTGAGGDASGSGGSTSFSIGQIDFIAFTNTMNAGVQQAYNDSLPLPLTGLTIQAVKQTKTVLIKWQTISEHNSSHFIVQRSANGTDFSLNIGTVDAAGNTNSLSKYSLPDINPLPGLNYYRIQEVDMDGKFIYSSTVAIKFDAGISATCYPNPATTILKLNLGIRDMAGCWYQLHDMNGKLVRSSGITGSVTSIPVNDLTPATYILTINNSAVQLFSFTVVKK